MHAMFDSEVFLHGASICPQQTETGAMFSAA